jgi:hypothetical protein
MPSVSPIDPPPDLPPPDEWTDRRAYANPRNNFVAVFHDPREFRMGADAWKIDLLEADRSIINDHYRLRDFGTGLGFHHTHPYQPWDSSGEILAVTDWSPKVASYSIRDRESIDWNDVAFPISIVGSFSIPRFAAVTTDGAFLHTSSGELISKLAVSTPKNEFPEFHWIADSSTTFAVGRASVCTPPSITFFDGESARLDSIEPVDPLRMLPYDAARYSRIPRNRFSLVINRGHRCVGSLLDTWSQIEFHPQKNELVLSIYRPTSDVFDLEGALACNVELKRTAIRIKA